MSEDTTEAVSPLRQRMIDDMTMRRLSPKTQTHYIRAVKRLARFLGRSPDTVNAEELRRFQLHLVQIGMSPISINSTIVGMRFFLETTLERLRQWWRLAKPMGLVRDGGWLFPSRNPIEPLCPRQLNRIIHDAARNAGIEKRVSMHTLRHCFATHLLEQKEDIRVIQMLLGHKKLNTTAHYTQVAAEVLQQVVSPIESQRPQPPTT